MATYVTDVLTATAAPVSGSPTPTRVWQWLRGSTVISGATTNSYTVTAEDLGQPVVARQVESNFVGEASAVSTPDGSVLAFEPAALFALNEHGVYYDPSDITTLYQDNTGSTPVTTAGQTVGLMLDKSKGLVLGPELVTNGDFSGGTTRWTPILASVSIVSGALRVSSSDNFARIRSTPFTTVIGKTYIATGFATYISGPENLYLYKSDDGAAVNQVATPTTVGGGPKNIVFVATATTTYIAVAHRFTGTVADWDNISVKELPGNHATQSILGQRPTYGIVPKSGRRNLLTYSEQFDNAVWSKVGTTSTANTVTAIASTDRHRISQVTATAPTTATTFWVEATAGTHSFIQIYNTAATGYYANFNLALGTVGSVGSLSAASIVPLGSGRFRCIVTFDASTALSTTFPIGLVTSASAAFNESWAAAGTETVNLFRAQLETGSTATAYQRITTTFDVTEAGVASVGYLAFETDKWMVTPTITPGTDKAQVFAGVRKLSTSVGVLLETSDNLDTNNGTFSFAAPVNISVHYAYTSKGTTPQGAAISSASYLAPVTNVISGLSDISGDVSTLRANGAQVSQVTGDQGTGNFLAYPLYIGRRGGTTLPFNGHLYPLIVRFGPNLSAARISAMESWVSTKTPGVTL